VAPRRVQREEFKAERRKTVHDQDEGSSDSQSPGARLRERIQQRFAEREAQQPAKDRAVIGKARRWQVLRPLFVLALVASFFSSAWFGFTSSPWYLLLAPLVLLAGVAMFYEDEAVNRAAAHAELNELVRRFGAEGARARCRHMFTTTRWTGVPGL
jgi:hypothetical protein